MLKAENYESEVFKQLKICQECCQLANIYSEPSHVSPTLQHGVILIKLCLKQSHFSKWVTYDLAHKDLRVILPETPLVGPCWSPGLGLGTTVSPVIPCAPRPQVARQHQIQQQLQLRCSSPPETRNMKEIPYFFLLDQLCDHKQGSGLKLC